MALVAVTMPKWGVMTEAVVCEWHAAVGDHVKAGYPLLSIETDKSTNEVEAPSDGTLMAILASLGEEMPVGALLAVLSDPPATADEVQRFIDSFPG